ncbi:DUF1801 domain-containing protein [Streptomyces sp. NPDC088725]|uniref:DUF1801 domain-containing protein n=1 Tax=Streptomyces sp. NPDC088725 TaxID=3365873 RepID=UPI0037F4ED16
MTEFVATHPEVRLIEGRFMQIQQAVGAIVTRRPETVLFLRKLVEEPKAGGFVADALRRANQSEAMVAPPAQARLCGPDPRRPGHRRYTGLAGPSRDTRPIHAGPPGPGRDRCRICDLVMRSGQPPPFDRADPARRKHNGRMDEELRAYIDGIAAEHRPLFDRIHRLILEAHPEAVMSLSYRMPTYTVGKRRLHVGVWKHGLSLYGWLGRDAGFASRHPALTTSKGTIRLRPGDAASIPDDELRAFARAALGTDTHP